MSDVSPKIPSQIFRWFEKMKSNYDYSIDVVLKRFENFNTIQQERLDKSNHDHIGNLKESHLQQIKQSSENIDRLQKDINYYKLQITNQQHTIEQLNSRYDAVMTTLLDEKCNNNQIKDIITTTDHATPDIAELLNDNEIDQQSTTIENNTVTENNELTCTDLYEQALSYRQSGDCFQAFLYFEQAANLNHNKAMGAMGRAYFLGEGVEVNSSIGLAWLINAANNNLPHAIIRVNDFQDNDPELYQQALLLADSL